MEKAKRIVRFSLSIILLITLFVFAMFQGGFVSWFLLYSFFPVGLYAVLLTVYPLENMHVERHIQARQFYVGEMVEVEITFTRAGFFPLVYLIVEEKFPQTLRSMQRRKKLLFPMLKKNFSIHYMIDTLSRGEHQFNNIEVTATDILGFCEKKCTFSIQQSFIVYPRYMDMMYRKSGQRFENGVATTSLQLRRDTTMAVGVRNYQPGDRVTWINWKASARTQELMTKEFEERQSEDIVFLLDRTPSEHFEAMVMFAASIIRVAIKSGVQVGFISVGGQQVNYTPQNSEDQRQRLLYHLATVDCDCKHSFAHVVKGVVSPLPLNATRCFITSTVTQELEKSFQGPNRSMLFVIRNVGETISVSEKSALIRLRQKGIVVRVLDEQYFANALIEEGMSL